MIFSNLYEYRELLKTSVKKDIRGRYKGSFLGILWSFINPLLQTLVYAIVFPLILKNKEDHFVTFLVCGIIPWNFFSASVMMGVGCVVANGGIIKKIYFPREIIPISVVVSGLVNFFIQLLIIVVFLLCSGIGLSWHFFYFPLIALIQSILLLGIILIVSSLCVYMRDLEYIISFFVNLAMYGSAVFYNVRVLKENGFAWVTKLNPMCVIIDSYRAIFMRHTAPDFKSIGIVAASSLVVTVIGFVIFRKLEKGFAEEL